MNPHVPCGTAVFKTAAIPLGEPSVTFRTPVFPGGTPSGQDRCNSHSASSPELGPERIPPMCGGMSRRTVMPALQTPLPVCLEGLLSPARSVSGTKSRTVLVRDHTISRLLKNPFQMSLRAERSNLMLESKPESEIASSRRTEAGLAMTRKQPFLTPC